MPPQAGHRSTFLPGCYCCPEQARLVCGQQSDFVGMTGVVRNDENESSVETMKDCNQLTFKLNNKKVTNMKTVLQSKDNAFNPVLYMAFELSAKKWKLAFGNGQRTRMKTIAAGDWSVLLAEIERAKAKLNCPADARVVSCYEAGRDGFWIHRALQAEGIENYVVDSASIEVSRRKRQVKTDRIDAGALLRLLMRYLSGEKVALHPVRVPTVAEDLAPR